MTGPELRAELQRVAEGAPAVHVDDDLFVRGRRSFRRRRIAAAAAAVACLAVVAGLLVPQLDTDDARVAGRQSRAGVPDHLFLPPPAAGEHQTADLRIGRAAAAFTADTPALGVPVVVSAEDGSYHVPDVAALMDSPMNISPLPIALSPDGRRLAWAFTEGKDARGRRPTGVRVADLTSGAVREIRLPAPHGVVIDDMAWSADSAWLGWHGQEAKIWTESSIVSTHPVAGAVGPTADTSTYQEVPEARVTKGGTVTAGSVATDVAVSDRGELAVLAGDTLWQQGARRRVDVRASEFSAGLWFNGSTVSSLVYRYRGRKAMAVVDLTHGRRTPLPSALREPHVAGVTDDGRLLVHDVEPDGDEPAGGGVMVLDPSGDRGPALRADSGITGLTLAADLMGDGTRTVSRPEPDWPTSGHRNLAVGGLAVGGLVALAGAGWLLRRQRAAR